MLPPQMKNAAGLRPTPMANITKAVTKVAPTAPVARPLSARFPGTEENLRKNMGLAPGSPATPLSAHIPGTEANLQTAAARQAPAAAAPAPARAAPGTAAHAAQWAKTPGLAPQASAPAKPSLASRAADAAAPVVRGAGAGIEAAGDALGAAGEKVKDVAGKGLQAAKDVAGKGVQAAKDVASKATAPAAPAGELTGAGKADSILNSIKLRHLPMAGAAAGMALGAIAPGTDEDGKKKSRIEGALMGGLTGGALGGLGMLPFAGGRRLYNTYAAPHMQMRAPAAAAAAAAPAGKRTAVIQPEAGSRQSLGGNTKRLAPGDPAAGAASAAAPAAAPAAELNPRQLRSQSFQSPAGEGYIDIGMGHPALQQVTGMPAHATPGTPERKKLEAESKAKAGV